MADDDTPTGGGNSWRLPTPSYQPYISNPLMQQVMAQTNAENMGAMAPYMFAARAQQGAGLQQYEQLIRTISDQTVRQNQQRMAHADRANVRDTTAKLFQHGMPLSAVSNQELGINLDRGHVAGGDASLMQERDARAFNQQAQGTQHYVEAGGQFPGNQPVAGMNAESLARLRGVMTNQPLDLRTAGVNAAASTGNATRAQLTSTFDAISGREGLAVRGGDAASQWQLAQEALRLRGITPQGLQPGAGGVAAPAIIPQGGTGRGPAVPPPAPPRPGTPVPTTGARLPSMRDPAVVAQLAPHLDRLGAKSDSSLVQFRQQGNRVVAVGPNGQTQPVTASAR